MGHPLEDSIEPRSPFCQTEEKPLFGILSLSSDRRRGAGGDVDKLGSCNEHSIGLEDGFVVISDMFSEP